MLPNAFKVHLNAKNTSSFMNSRYFFEFILLARCLVVPERTDWKDDKKILFCLSK